MNENTNSDTEINFKKDLEYLNKYINELQPTTIDLRKPECKAALNLINDMLKVKVILAREQQKLDKRQSKR